MGSFEKKHVVVNTTIPNCRISKKKMGRVAAKKILIIDNIYGKNQYLNIISLIKKYTV